MTKFFVKPTPDNRWSVCETGQSLPLDSFETQWRANFWSDRLNKAYADGASTQQQARPLPKESLPEFGKEVKQQQPMTATEFPIGILLGWMQEVTAMLYHIGRDNNARYPQVFIGLEAFQYAAREKGLL